MLFYRCLICAEQKKMGKNAKSLKLSEGNWCFIHWLNAISPIDTSEITTTIIHSTRIEYADLP